MKEILDFLSKVKNLEELPRTGWILMGIEEPETVAEHTFRLAIIADLFAQKMGLNPERAIRIALFHDLCELYAGDITTLLYHPELQKEKNKEKRKKIEMKWARLSHLEKKELNKIKLKKEKESLLKLIKNLKPELKREILSLWLDYENGISREGRLVRQLNGIETLIQSIEYFGPDQEESGTTWWESTEEIVEDPLLVKFLEIIQKKFYGKKRISDENLKGILDFTLKVGKLKKMPRRGWVLRRVKKPETMGNHFFMMMLFAWIFSHDKSLRLHQQKLLKMALYHEVCEIYSGDRTPYDEILKDKSGKEKRDILKKWIRFSKKEKAEWFIKDYQEEKKALEKITKNLNKAQGEEMIRLWDEFKTGSSPEGRFLNQMEILSVLFKALDYFSKEKKFPIAPFWEWAFEALDHDNHFIFVEELKKKFY